MLTIKHNIHIIPGANAHCDALVDILKANGIYPPALNPEGEGDEWLAAYLVKINLWANKPECFLRVDTTDNGTVIAHRKRIGDNKVMVYAWVDYNGECPEDCYLLTVTATV